MHRTLFVVSRGHPDLYTYLQERFATDPAVEIVIDRRVGARRQQPGRCDLDRRLTDRRRRPEIEAELKTRSHAILTLPDPVSD